ncbi:protein kinase domain-containing protein [Rhodococcus opacus]|uniref:protein kinase domain-containing protein n=1 Tax=Rhodococcus opacus TaxID=37919 RepID=UPI00155AD5AC|nr:protein kinase [Rhodococcus opacus]
MAEVDPLATQRASAVDIAAELAAEGFQDAHEIAHGGFGVVYRCEQPALERTVAVKVLTADLDDENFRRFIEEQHAMGRLSGHPNIVTILHTGATESGRPYIVMPYHRQKSLETHIREHGPIGWADALRLGVKIAGALAAAHRIDILHRDVKPGNILLTEYGEPELTDFGIARITGGVETAAGIILGSPAFTAPEVLRGEPASVASDLYGLGATLFCAITGHAAFERRSGEDVVAQFLRITNEPVPSLHDYDLPSDIVAVIERAMAQDPKDRPTSTTEYGEELRAVQRSKGLAVNEMAMPTALATEQSRNLGTTGSGAAAIPTTARHNISADVTSFVGRGQETREIRTLLRKTRLLTLTGIGGVGKSRLAKSAGLAIQRAFRDGVWLTDFNFVQDGKFIQQAIQDSTPGPATVLSLVEQLRNKNLMLILDNCDKLTEEIADTAAHLLTQCPEVKILATSRTPLDISAEYVLNIHPFIPDTDQGAQSEVLNDAVTLFRDRAQAVGGWKYDSRAENDLVQLCIRLDGLPLAIELAALRTRTMPIQEINRRLTDRFGLLKGGPRDMHPRHRSLWTLLEWTWDQCNVAEKSLWAQFSVFVGSAGLDAVRHICALGSTADVGDVVEGLVQNSILTRRRSGDAIRFQMLDTIREFGQLMLERDAGSFELSASPADLRDRHLHYYAALAAQAEGDWFGPNQFRSRSIVASEISNMRAAFDWALETPERSGTATTMVADLWFYWLGCGHLKEGRLWSEHAWNRLHDFGIPYPARALWVLGWNLLITGEVTGAEVRLQECLSEAARQGDARAASFGRALLGAVRCFQDDYAAGVELYTTAIAEAKQRGDQLATALFLHHLGEVYCLYREFDLAEECCRESIAICDRYGDQWCNSLARWVQALCAFMQKSTERAASIAATALTGMTTIEDQLGIALVGELFAWIAAENGEYSEAAALLGATGTYWSASGSSVMGLHRLMEYRESCLATIEANVTDRDFKRSTEKGARLGFDGIAILALPAARVGVPESGRVPTEHRSIPDRGRVSTAPKPSAALESLTPREWEIARLVTQGMTNKEIAAELIIGKRTVDTHVAHVLAKCGLRRRSEIASLIATSRDDS